MSRYDIQSEKLSLISWISQLSDDGIIKHLRAIQKDNTPAEQWQKKVVRKRIKTTDEKSYLTWKEIEKQLNLKK